MLNGTKKIKTYEVPIFSGRVKFFLSFLFLFPLTGFSQQSVQWQQSFGGSGNDDAFSITNASDSGFIIVGYSSSPDGDITNHIGTQDFWIIKLDNTGGLEWEQSFGGSNFDVPRSIVQTNDRGYVVAGYSWSTDGYINFGENHGMDDYWIVKLDESGGMMWQTMFGGTGNDEAYSVIQTKDTGFLVAGNSNSTDHDVIGNHGGYDYWIVKLDSNGAKQWQKILGGSSHDYATSVAETSDGGYVVAGYSASNDSDVSANYGYNDFWVIKLNTAGALLWQKNYGGSSDDRAFSIIETSDHYLIVAGLSYSNDSDVTGNHGNGDYWVIKLDSLGNLKWQRALGGGSYDEANCVIESNYGGYVVSGKSFSNDGDVSGNNGSADYWVAKLDTSGNIIGQKSLGGSNDEKNPAIIQASDGSYVVAGTSASNDKDVSGNHGGDDYWVVKLASNIGIGENKNRNDFQIVPNPSDGKFKVCDFRFGVNTEVEIYDLMGTRLVQKLSPASKEGNVGVHYFNIDAPAGIYFLHILTKDGETVKKLVISR